MPITRRGLIAATCLAAAIPTHSLAAQQATPDSTPTDGLQPDGSWRFTDDRPLTVELPGMPTSIVAQTTSAAGLWDFGVHIAGVFGPYRDLNGTPDPATGNMDLDEVTWLGDYGELDIEQLIALDAEIYVDINRGVTPLWYIDDQLEHRIEDIVKTISIDAVDTTVKHSIQRFEQLAVALGADLTNPDIAAAREAFEKNEAALMTLASDKPDVQVLVLTGDPESGAYFVNPDVTFDLLYYRELGLNLVQPEHPDASTGGNFEVVSWEQLGKYPADVILYDDRSDIAALDGDPVWEILPAVKAGQVGPWPVTFQLSWNGLGLALGHLIETLSGAKVVR
ncbi:MAG TPA: ABC transporter substrate-binding protein [Thermomicrobiales bacterium]|nr:ABC transporter substrate-binding protein [Thermomicrobiales bacterium]